MFRVILRHPSGCPAASTLLALPLAALVPGAGAAAFGQTVTQTFDSAPADWVGSGNTSSGNNFGFLPTDETGGASGPGEAGGTFVRTVGLHYYADTTLGGTLSLNNPLTLSGEFDITAARGPDHAFGVGFFNTTTPNPGGELPNFL